MPILTSILTASLVTALVFHAENARADAVSCQSSSSFSRTTVHLGKNPLVVANRASFEGVLFHRGSGRFDPSPCS